MADRAYSFLALPILSLILGVGCSTSPEVGKDSRVGNERPRETGWQRTTESETDPLVAEPNPDENPIVIKEAAERGVVLLLTGGGLRTYCALGAARALELQRIPLRGIIGLEMGALIGGILATSTTVNEAEWRVLKLKDGDLFKPSQGVGRFFGGERRQRSFEESVIDIFDDKDRLTGDLEFIWLQKKEKGSWTTHVGAPDPKVIVAEVLRSQPGSNRELRRMGKLDAKELRGLSDELRTISHDLTRKGHFPLVVLDCSVEQDNTWTELDFVSRVVAPKLGAMGADESKRKSEAKWKGKEAMDLALRSIGEELKRKEQNENQ